MLRVTVIGAEGFVGSAFVRYLRNADVWKQTNAILYGANKSRSNASIMKTGKKGTITGCGYGGHFRAVQSFKYLGK